MKSRLFLALLASLSSVIALPAFADDAGRVAGLTLLESPGARASAMGGSFSAVTDDIEGLSYNPATVGSLATGQASLLYQRGAIEDRYAHLSVGAPSGAWGWGASLGYYDAGTFSASDDGVTRRTLSAQTDYVATVGLARSIERWTFGAAVKYFSSTVGETDHATAAGLDLGALTALSHGLQLGASLQNLGTSVKYGDVAERLPSLLRVGASASLLARTFPLLLAVDIPYAFRTAALHPGIGVEKALGPLVLRAGYRNGSDLEGFTVGAGFAVRSVSLDYAFGLVEKLDARQRISLSYRFGPAAEPVGLVAAPAAVPFTTSKNPRKRAPDGELKPFVMRDLPPVPALVPQGGETRPQRVYEVRPGDTWALIAKREYGRASMAPQIQRANQHVLPESESLKPGMKIVLP